MAGVHRLQQIEGLGPRTSPTMMRSGRMRRQFLTRSRMVTSPSPSRIGRAGFQAHHMGLLQLKFGAVFAGDDALVGRR
jgi:hypothetical protein